MTSIVLNSNSNHTSRTSIKNPIPPNPFDESVYLLLPVDYIPPTKQNMYRSKFAPEARVQLKKGKKHMATLGPKMVQKPDPKQFLKKHEREQKPPQNGKGDRDRVVRKAPLPKDPGHILGKTHKNFIKANALENIHSVAKKSLPEPPKFVTKQDYGKTPHYIDQRRSEDEHRKACEVQEKSAEGVSEEEGLVMLPEQERMQILAGLKKNWQKLNSDYQKLSLTVDTVPKIARKVNMEQQLKKLEHDIHIFNQPNIYVNFGKLSVH